MSLSDFDHITFAYPWVFWLLLLLPLMVLWYVKKSRKSQAAMQVSSIRHLKAGSSFKNSLVHVPFILRFAAAALIIVAIARPQIRNREEQVSGEGVDIILCIDVSGSMTTEYFTPNRIEAAKREAIQFVEHRPTDRIGVVIFSGESFTVCPLTTDHQAVINQIEFIRNGLLEDGTAIGSGLATCVERLKDSPSKTKIVILMTDGVNTGGLIDPLTAKEIAKAMGVKVYTIGIGSDSGYLPEPTGVPAGSSPEKAGLDEKLLKDIATSTGGLYFRARNTQGLDSIYHDIDGMEKSKVEVTTYVRASEVFQPLAFAALFLLVAEMLLRYTVLRKFP